MHVARSPTHTHQSKHGAAQKTSSESRGKIAANATVPADDWQAPSEQFSRHDSIAT